MFYYFSQCVSSNCFLRKLHTLQCLSQACGGPPLHWWCNRWLARHNLKKYISSLFLMCVLKLFLAHVAMFESGWEACGGATEDGHQVSYFKQGSKDLTRCTHLICIFRHFFLCKLLSAYIAMVELGTHGQGASKWVGEPGYKGATRDRLKNIVEKTFYQAGITTLPLSNVIPFFLHSHNTQFEMVESSESWWRRQEKIDMSHLSTGFAKKLTGAQNIVE